MQENKPPKPLDETSVIQHSQEWLNDHGHPSYSQLMKLAEDGTIESREQLMELAQNYDIPYDRATTPYDLIERIMLYREFGPNFN
jgi:hypothetical protein